MGYNRVITIADEGLLERMREVTGGVFSDGELLRVRRVHLSKVSGVV